MKVYRPDGSFITRAERQQQADERKDKKHRTIALVVLTGIIVFCIANNIPLLENPALLN